ncbi:MAG: aminoacyl-tRNA hydrolase [Pseudomonadota bacterium]
MMIIAGLGNPGTKHAKQRHNIGFMAVDAIASLHGFDKWRRQFNAETAQGRIGGQKVLLIKPQTFMNKSGSAIAGAVRFFKAPLDKLMVCYDDLDLAPGKVRIKQGGGHGGHNGLRSIDSHLGPHYWRLRLGIGHPGDKARVTGYVLGDFPKADHEWLVPLIAGIAQEAPDLAKGDHGGFMNRVALHLQAEVPQMAKGQAGKGQTGQGQTGKSHPGKNHQQPKAKSQGAPAQHSTGTTHGRGTQDGR